MTILRIIIGILVTLAVAGFTAFNLQSVDIVYSPFNEAISVPLYAVAIGFSLFGFVMGALITWVNSSGVRKERRKLRKQVRTLEKELDCLQGDKFSPPSEASQNGNAKTDLPVITSK